MPKAASLSPLSTKPRIETPIRPLFSRLLLCLSPLSTKPRIETGLAHQRNLQYRTRLSPLSTKPRIETRFLTPDNGIILLSKSFIH